MIFAVNANHLAGKRVDARTLLAHKHVMRALDVSNQVGEEFTLPGPIAGGTRFRRALFQARDDIVEGNVRRRAGLTESAAAATAIINSELLEFAGCAGDLCGDFADGVGRC